MRIRVVPADGQTTVSALELLYGGWPLRERMQFVRDALNSAASGQLNLRHLIVACADQGERVVGAALAVERPGREAIVWIPGFAPEVDRAQVGSQLLQELNRRLDRAGLACAVCFVDPRQTEDRRLLELGGFPGIADLCLLRCDPNQPGISRQSPLSGLAWTGWSELAASEFAVVIDRTLQATLDCPEIRERRSGYDVLASHCGDRAPTHDQFRIYRQAHSPTDAVGVMLLADQPAGGELEVLYLGVVAEMRRQGIARSMLIDAVNLARARRRVAVTVAVESRNVPALTLYHRLGFAESRRFSIHLRVGSDATAS